MFHLRQVTKRLVEIWLQQYQTITFVTIGRHFVRIAV